MQFSKSQLLDSLLWGSTVGYPSDSLASCSIYKNLIPHFILHYRTFKKLQKALNSFKIYWTYGAKCNVLLSWDTVYNVYQTSSEMRNGSLWF